MTAATETWVMLRFRALPYQHWGMCADCGRETYVARLSQRTGWRCVDCFDQRLARMARRRSK